MWNACNALVKRFSHLRQISGVDITTIKLVELLLLENFHINIYFILFSVYSLVVTNACDAILLNYIKRFRSGEQSAMEQSFLEAFLTSDGGMAMKNLTAESRLGLAVSRGSLTLVSSVRSPGALQMIKQEENASIKS